MDILFFPVLCFFIGVIPTVLVMGVYEIIFGHPEEQKHMGVKVAGLSTVVGAILYYFFF